MLSSEELKQQAISEQHLQLLNHVKNLVRLSREHMSKKYEDWDAYDDTYRGIRELDDQDRKLREKKEPLKMVVPLGFAQLQTFVAFCFSVFTQREFFFELIGASPEDCKAAEKGEALLQRDLDHNRFALRLYQYLIDIGRFGIGIMKCHWVEEKQWIDATVPAKTLNFLGISVQLKSARTMKIEATKYQGNHVVNISPYKFFPDPRLPISRFQEGEFVAVDEEYTVTDLKKLEAEGVCFGIDFIQPFRDIDETRRSSRFGFIDPVSKEVTSLKSNAKPSVCITEVQIKLIPSQFVLDGETQGTENYPVKYLLWIANDSRIVRCQPLDYLHDEFTFVVSEMTPDMHHLLNAGLLEGIDELQDVVSWLINSHITSVRRIIQNALVVDPDGVNMDDIKNHRPVIRLQPGAARSGVERWIKQLDVHDATSGHIQDAMILKQMIEVVTGINDNLLGQFHGGRRSATEARNVTMSAASRVKMIASLIFASGLEPLGKQMLSNLRDGLTVEAFVRMFGSAANDGSYQYFKKITRQDLVGDYDFAIFDGTLPSEKYQHAEFFIEVLKVLLTNPQAIMITGLDPKLILFEVFKLRGIRYPERFSLQNNLALGSQLAQMQQQQMMNGQPGNQQVQQPVGGGEGQTPPELGGAPNDNILAGMFGA